MRTPVIAGNWKMHLSPDEGVELVEALIPRVGGVSDVEIVVCPAYPALQAVSGAIGGSNIKLGAQNLYPMAEGAFTGEISPTILKAVGCSYVILGHSERRQYFWESDAFVNAKIKAALEFGLVPIVCVGESLGERANKRTFDKIGHQIDEAFRGIGEEDSTRLIVAYEPIWAIGTGQTATPEQAQDIHHFIRHKLNLKYDKARAEEIRILYGGSVKPENVDELMAQADIDGALVGGASLKADSFAGIVNYGSHEG